MTLVNAEEKMYTVKTLEREMVRNSSFESIISSYHDKNPEERGHSVRVSELCQIVGDALHMSMDELRKLKRAGYLHDVGKIVLSTEILDINHKLIDEEWRDIKRHPIVGYRILNYFEDTMDLAEIILAHHEHWDGTGYPKGIKGEEIPVSARIISITESFDRMTHLPSNSKSKSPDEAIQIILDHSGTQFDPEIAGIFVRSIAEISNYTT